MRLAAALARDLEAVADLDALHGLDAHQRLREQAVDLAVPVHVRTETRRHAVAEHLDDPAEGVADLRGRFDLGDHRRLGVRVEAPHRGLVDHVEIVGRGTPLGRRARRTHLDHVADDLRADLREHQLGERPGRDPSCGLSRAGALEHVAGVVEAVLLHADEIGVTGPGLAQRLLRRAGRRRHLLLPLRPLGVVDHDRDRRPEREAVADAAEDLDVVALEAHARPAPEAETAPGQLVAELLDGDRETGREAFHDQGQRGTV